MHNTAPYFRKDLDKFLIGYKEQPNMPTQYRRINRGNSEQNSALIWLTGVIPDKIFVLSACY